MKDKLVWVGGSTVEQTQTLAGLPSWETLKWLNEAYMW